MTSPLIPAEDLPLLASYGRTCSANVNAVWPDHAPPRRRKPLLPAWMFLPMETL